MGPTLAKGLHFEHVRASGRADASVAPRCSLHHQTPGTLVNNCALSYLHIFTEGARGRSRCLLLLELIGACIVTRPSTLLNSTSAALNHLVSLAVAAKAIGSDPS